MNLGILYLVARLLTAGATFGRALVVSVGMSFWAPSLFAMATVGRVCGTHSLLVAQQATALVCIKAVMLLCAVLCPVWRMRSTGVGPLLPHPDGEGRRWKFW